MASKTLEYGNLKIIITDEHIHYKGTPIMHCHRLGIDTKPLEKMNFDRAVIEAVAIVRGRILELLSNLQSIEHKYKL